MDSSRKLANAWKAISNMYQISFIITRIISTVLKESNFILLYILIDAYIFMCLVLFSVSSLCNGSIKWSQIQKPNIHTYSIKWE